MREILTYLGEPTSPPRMAPARGPPLWEMADAGQGQFDPNVQPAPDYEFDQRIAWQVPRQSKPPLPSVPAHGATRAWGQPSGRRLPLG